MAKVQLGRYNRVLITGDRSWPKDGYHIIKARLEKLPKTTLIIVSEAQGADQQADIAASLLSLRSIRVKMEEDKYGRYADLVRNIRMFEQYKPQLVIAFHSHKGDVKGTKHVLMMAEKRGIPTETVSLKSSIAA